jgi:hypothetical protein
MIDLLDDICMQGLGKKFDLFDCVKSLEKRNLQTLKNVLYSEDDEAKSGIIAAIVAHVWIPIEMVLIELFVAIDAAEGVIQVLSQEGKTMVLRFSMN